MIVSPDVGHMHCEYAPQKQCWKKTWRAAAMAQHCPREREPITRSEGRDNSGTGIMLPVHLQRGGSAQLSWSAFHKWNGRVFRGGWGGYQEGGAFEPWPVVQQDCGPCPKGQASHK